MENNTKENILCKAVKLFSINGYMGTSMSDIAATLGITKAALYKHYKSKQEIFDCIVERMNQMDEERTKKYEMPEGTFVKMATDYNHMEIEKIRIFSAAQFKHWTEDEFARDFRRILTLEQYRSEKMGQLYQAYLVNGPVEYMTKLFGEMFRQNNHADANAKHMALNFYGPIYLMINMYDVTEDKEELMKLLMDHVSHFEKEMEEFI